MCKKRKVEVPFLLLVFSYSHNTILEKKKQEVIIRPPAQSRELITRHVFRFRLQHLGEVPWSGIGPVVRLGLMMWRDHELKTQ